MGDEATAIAAAAGDEATAIAAAGDEATAIAAGDEATDIMIAVGDTVKRICVSNEACLALVAKAKDAPGWLINTATTICIGLVGWTGFKLGSIIKDLPVPENPSDVSGPMPKEENEKSSNHQNGRRRLPVMDRLLEPLS